MGPKAHEREEAVYARCFRNGYVDPFAGESSQYEKKKWVSPCRGGGEHKSKKTDYKSSSQKGGGPPEGKYKYYTPLIATAEQIFKDLQYYPDLKWPGKLRTDPRKRSNDKYCRFHRNHDHNTDDCYYLK